MLEGILTRDADARPEDAFVRLADRELQRAYRLAGLLLGNAHEAEDATQDALVRAWSAASSLRDSNDFQAWFDRILVNVCRDRLRRRRTIRFLPMDTEHEQRPAVDPFAELIAQDELLTAVAALDEELRAIVVLRYWSDLTVDEIARRVGRPSGTVKSRLHRALSQMRAQLQTAAPSGETIR